MSYYIKYFAQGGSCPKEAFPCDSIPPDAAVSSVCMDGNAVENSIYGSAGWLVKNFKAEGLVKHDSDELHIFIGGNALDPENLNATVDFQIENDHLVFSETSFVFVPAGAAHGVVSVSGLTRPVFHHTIHVNSSFYKEEPAVATISKGTHANNRVVKYAPTDGRIPEAPEGFITFLLWIDGAKLKGAPYTEAVWFHTTNDTGPENHTHEDLDEFIAFIGSDPWHPEELNGEISFFIGDEQIFVTKSCLIFIPRGIAHSPLLVHKLEKPIIHFSGGNSGDYNKDINSSFNQ
jgi:mannose-6-phosphate isomerase-like protein (cupin superfamily)